MSLVPRSKSKLSSPCPYFSPFRCICFHAASAKGRVGKDWEPSDKLILFLHPSQPEIRVKCVLSFPRLYVSSSLLPFLTFVSNLHPLSGFGGLFKQSDFFLTYSNPLRKLLFSGSWQHVGFLKFINALEEFSLSIFVADRGRTIFLKVGEFQLDTTYIAMATLLKIIRKITHSIFVLLMRKILYKLV